LKARAHPGWPKPRTKFNLPVRSLPRGGFYPSRPLEYRRTDHLRSLVQRQAAGEKVPTISIGGKQGIIQAVVHLVERGHQDIAFVARVPQDKGDRGIRFRVFQDVIAAHNLRTDPGLVEWPPVLAVMNSFSYCGRPMQTVRPRWFEKFTPGLRNWHSSSVPIRPTSG
jgi:hypothetical protein